MSDEQLKLAEWDEEALVQDEQRRGVFSGTLLKKSNPEKYDLICHYLASEVPVARIARLVCSSRNLISAIKRAQPVEIEHEKQKIAAGSAHVIDLITERQIEILNDPQERKKVGFRDLTVSKGIEVDKFQITSGGATSRLEVVVGTGPEHEEFLIEIGLGAGIGGQKARVLEGEAVEIGPPPALPAPPEAPAGAQEPSLQAAGGEPEAPVQPLEDRGEDQATGGPT